MDISLLDKESIKKLIGKTIQQIDMEGDTIYIYFTDGSNYEIDGEPFLSVYHVKD